MKIKWSALVSDVRGKLNGSVASRNRYGSYFRNKMTPVNPRTNYQMAVRGAFASISGMWKKLTQAQRDAWASQAKDHPYTDIFGDQHTLQANSYFQKINMLLSTVNLPLLETPVAMVIPVYKQIDIVTPFDNTNMVIEVSPWLVDEATPKSIAIYATPPVSAGREFLKNEYRHIGSIDFQELVDNEIDVQQMYEARFGAGVVGSRIGIGIVGITDAGGVSVMSTVNELFQ